MAWFTRSKSEQGSAAEGAAERSKSSQDRAGEVSEAEIAVHWQEEGLVRPPEKFIAQANLTDKAIFDRFYIGVPLGADYVRWDDPFLSEILFSSRHGLFSWSPILLAAAIGFAGFIRAQRPAHSRRELRPPKCCD